ncbi:RNA-directed DNA polymerase [Alteraurantiacibacter palmitatis]|uniref:RNA-directed DNA polymerase n=1 Tax=Alteraurantiacibacter palmitatis TaxID=2054628 RepID=A0ABV7E4P1_9SPHN
MEKSKGLCRQIALPDPSDALILQILSNALWREVSKHAPSQTAFYAPQDQPFAKVNVEDEEDQWGYGPIESWLDFQKEILKFSQNRKFIVVTDIANYYDFIIHQFLRSILSDYGLEKEYSLDLLLFILDAMLWRPDYMPNFGIGLPQMDFDAPRLLAHTHLFEIDALFSVDPDADYARYMDDIDFGVDSIAKAKSVLRDLDLSLQTRNLRVNSGKTKILTASEAEKHFKILENAFIEKISVRLKKKYFLQYWENIYGRMSIWLLRSNRGRDAFKDGNGPKLIKRLLAIAKNTRTPIPDDIFFWLLSDQPGLRKELFAAWSKSGVTKNQIDRLIDFFRSGEAVDDMVYILSMVAMSQTRFSRKFKNSQFSALRLALKGNEPSMTYSRLLMVSRFDNFSLLWSEVKSTLGVWSRHKFLSRQVAGFSPLFYGTSLWSEFSALIRRWSGDEGMSVFEFHDGLRTDPKRYKAVKAFLKAGNSSSGTEISHAKALMILSVVQNDDLKKLDRAQLVAQHPTMMSDAYYQPLFSRALSNMK